MGCAFAFPHHCRLLRSTVTAPRHSLRCDVGLPAASSSSAPQVYDVIGQFAYPTTGANSSTPGPYPPELAFDTPDDEVAQAAENAAKQAGVGADELLRRADSPRRSARDSVPPVQLPDATPAVESEATEDAPPPVESPPSPAYQRIPSFKSLRS